MNIEEKIQKIKEKLSNLPTEFSMDEKYIVDNNKELQQYIIEYIIARDNLCTQDVLDCLPSSIYELMQQEYAEIFYAKYMPNFLETNLVSTTEVEIACRQVGISLDKIEELKKLVIQRFLDPEAKIDTQYTSAETIRELLKYKRFDLVSQISNKSVAQDIVYDVMEVYPFDSHPIPKCLLFQEEVVKKYVDRYSIEELIATLEHSFDPFSYSYNYDAMESITSTTITEIMERLKVTDKIDIARIKAISPNIIFANFTRESLYDEKSDTEERKQQKRQIALCLFRNGAYELATALYSEQLLTTEEIKKVIIDLLNSNNRTGFSRIPLRELTNILYKDKEILDLLLKKGFIEELEMLQGTRTESQTEYIIEQLKQKNPDFKEYASNLAYTSENLELYTAMLESGFVEKISVISNWSYASDKETFQTQIKFLLKVYPDIEFEPYSTDEECMYDLIDTLLETNRTNSIIEFMCRRNITDFKKFYNKANQNNAIINLIRTDIEKGYQILEHNFREILEDQELFDLYLEQDVYTDLIINYINHQEELTHFYNDEMYEKFKNFLSRKYNVPLDKLDKLKDFLGPIIIRNIDNAYIHDLLELSEEQFEKLTALFPKVEYTLQDLEGAYDSLKQYELSKKYPSDIQIFPSILHAISENNQDELDKLCQKLSQELDSNFLKQFLKKYELPSKYTIDNIDELVYLVIEKIKISTGEKLEKYRLILHEMTDYYISKKREQYRTNYDMENELNLPYELEPRSKENALIRQIILDSKDTGKKVAIVTKFEGKEEELGFFGMYSTKEVPVYEYIVSKMIEEGVDAYLAADTIDYYIKRDKNNRSNLKEVQKTIPTLIKVVKDLISYVREHPYNYYNILSTFDFDEYIAEADKKGEIKRNYTVGSQTSLIDIVSQLDIEALSQGVLSDQEAYESLLEIMTKRKLHLLPTTLSNLLSTEYIDISSDLTNISGFISYYGKIYSDAKKALEAAGKSTDSITFNVANALIQAAVHSEVSSVYSHILGPEDAKLIKGNPGPNQALRKVGKEERLAEAVELTKTLFERQTVTIPTFNEVFTLPTGKRMRIVVGNFTNPCNLTHGERTGACMRIGGAGETLYEFAINNPNGFHIRFEDPDTGEYISRVTGFRNGNTVFLNELRRSCNQEKYQDTDVVDACKEAAQTIIDMSLNSTCQIDNVVVHKAYALDSSEEPIVWFNIGDNKKGLPYFYSDISNSGIVLATTATEGKIVPVDFDKSKVPTYEPARDLPYVCKNEQEAVVRINRVVAVKKILAGENYEFIEPPTFENSLIYAIVSHDWYIYVDSEGNIIKDAIDIDPRAKEELAQAVIEVENNLSNIQAASQEKKYGV